MKPSLLGSQFVDQEFYAIDRQLIRDALRPEKGAALLRNHCSGSGRPFGACDGEEWRRWAT
jgi:hypothetical protein